MTTWTPDAPWRAHPDLPAAAVALAEAEAAVEAAIAALGLPAPCPEQRDDWCRRLRAAYRADPAGAAGVEALATALDGWDAARAAFHRAEED